MNELEIAQEPDAAGKTSTRECFGYRVLRGKGSISIEWSLPSIAEGDIFSIQRSTPSGGNYREIKKIRARSGEITFKYLDRSCRPGKSYRYRVAYRPAWGTSCILFETEKYVAAELPTALHPNYPNPFDASTELRFSVAEKGKISLAVYDVEGRLVRVLVNSTLKPGRHTATWDGLDYSGNIMATGVYFCYLRAGRETISRKLVLIR